MTFLEALVKARWKDAASVERMPLGGWRVVVHFSDRDVSCSRMDRGELAREVEKRLEPRPRKVRRLHWGKRK